MESVFLDLNLGTLNSIWPLASDLHLHMCLALHGDTDFSYGATANGRLN